MPTPVLGTGAGKTYEEREVAKRVRNLTLTQMESILQRNDEDELKKALILKLAGTVLPRLTEVTGAEGGPVQIEGVEISIRKA